MRIGLVGYGFGGRFFHLPYIQAVPEWSVAGVVTRSPENRRALAAEAPGARAFDELDALLDAGVDAVVISTPPETRRDLVLRAVERGVPTVADKPFAPDGESARTLARAAEEAGVLVTVYQNRRWDTDFLTAQEVVRSGDLGEIWRATLRMDLDDPETLEAGPAHGLLRDLGSHLVDQAVQLLGRVSGVRAHLDHAEIDGQRIDVGFTLGLQHVSGAFSTVSASKMNRIDEKEILVYGSNGSYVSRMSDVQTEQILAGRRPATARDRWGVEDRSRWGCLNTPDGTRTVEPTPGNYAEYYRNLLRAVGGEAEAAVSLEDVIHTIDILDAARTSDSTEAVVTLD